MDFWLLAFQAAGMTFVVTRSGLFAPLREHGPEAWRSFIGCSLCVGVWVGLFLTAAQLAAAGYRPIGPGAIAAWALTALGTGALGGAIALGFTVAIDLADGVAAASDQWRLLAKLETARREQVPDAASKAVTRPDLRDDVAAAERAIDQRKDE